MVIRMRGSVYSVWPVALNLLFTTGAYPQIVDDAGNRIVLATTFSSPLTADDALNRLEEYYRIQIDKERKQVLGEIAPGRYFESWRRIWISIEPRAPGITVTLRNSAAEVPVRQAKSWLLEVAGRMGADAPLTFHQSAPLQSASAELYTGRRDLQALLEKARPELREAPALKQAALFAGAEPWVVVELNNSGALGLSRLTVTAEQIADARQLLARLSQPAAMRICAVINETAALESEVRRLAVEHERDARIKYAGLLMTLGTGSKSFEEEVRAQPEMKKRLAAAQDSFLVRYRLDRTYHTVVVSWSKLTNYSPATGHSDEETQIGQIAPPQTGRAEAGKLLDARFRIAQVEIGAYRVRLVGDGGKGTPEKTDDRVFWFDGTLFQEL
jgi:hypothetical protein